MCPHGFVAVHAQIDFSRLLFQSCSHSSYYHHTGGCSRTCGLQMDIQQTLPAQRDCSPRYSYEDNCYSSPCTVISSVSIHQNVFWCVQRRKAALRFFHQCLHKLLFPAIYLPRWNCFHCVENVMKSSCCLPEWSDSLAFFKKNSSTFLNCLCVPYLLAILPYDHYCSACWARVCELKGLSEHAVKRL